MKNMNKIIITDDNIETKGKDILLQVDDNNIIKNVSLDILNDSDLEFEYNIKESIKINILINISNNIKCNIIDKKIGNSIKVKYNYNIGENSNLNINIINDVDNIREYDLVNLNGENSSIKYILKTICKNKENYDIIINHYQKNTSSELITNGININEGSLSINATGYVPKGSCDSNIVQNNKIINLTNNMCNINPVLLIDEVSVSANHSAHISNFDPNDLFYLESRGISEKDSTTLLIKGFLNSNLELIDSKYTNKICEKYWR